MEHKSPFFALSLQGECTVEPVEELDSILQDDIPRILHDLGLTTKEICDKLMDNEPEELT